MTDLGYDPVFLTEHVDPPALGADLRPDLASTLSGDDVVAHTHFSLQMCASRRFAFWVGWNIDGGSLKALSRRGLRFVADPQIADEHQVGDVLYADNNLDRGHLARRADLLWGELAEAKRANVDSFFFTNITPQLSDFNQSAKAGLWGRLEDAVFADVEVADLRVSVFGGPVFQPDDRPYRGVRLPREYWKVLAFRDAADRAAGVRARAFLLAQNLDHLRSLELDEFRVYQVRLDDLERRTGLRFPDVLRAGDLPPSRDGAARPAPLRDLADIRW